MPKFNVIVQRVQDIHIAVEATDIVKAVQLGEEIAKDKSNEAWDTINQSATIVINTETNKSMRWNYI